jgi:hypothetical protein
MGEGVQMSTKQQKYGNALGREGGWEVPQNTINALIH